MTSTFEYCFHSERKGLTYMSRLQSITAGNLRQDLGVARHIHSREQRERIACMFSHGFGLLPYTNPDPNPETTPPTEGRASTSVNAVTNTIPHRHAPRLT